MTPPLDREDVFNKFGVSAYTRSVVLLAPPLINEVLTKREALLLAAWIVAVVHDDDEFARLLEAVRET